MARVAHVPPQGPIHVRSFSRMIGGVIPWIAQQFSRRSLTDCKGICVVQGPGSFSAVRSGILFANVAARVLRLPLYGVSCDEAHDLRVLRDRLVARTILPTSYVAPLYDAEPNITMPGRAS